MNRTLLNRTLALALVCLLGGVPQVFAQTTAPATTQEPQQTQQNPNMTADPTQGPVEPAQSTQPQEQVQPEQPLPDAPSATTQPSPGNQPEQTAPANATSSSRPQEPAGTAAAGSAATVGGAASKPAGTAIAPAKQRQVRSLLIKLGAIAAAGAALGIVYGLSRSTSPKPPGATTTAAPAP
jgi:outer membrane biosynthesis protein TonB